MLELQLKYTYPWNIYFKEIYVRLPIFFLVNLTEERLVRRRLIQKIYGKYRSREVTVWAHLITEQNWLSLYLLLWNFTRYERNNLCISLSTLALIQQENLWFGILRSRFRVIKNLLKKLCIRSQNFDFFPRFCRIRTSH